MSVAQLSASLALSIHDTCVFNSPRTHATISRLPTSNFTRLGSTFATGSPLLISRTSLQRKAVSRAKSVTIRCEQSSEDGNLDVWLGRLAMVGFAAAISVEVGTGKGLLENFGLTSPLPVVALAVTALIGVLTAIFIFQSASPKD